MWNVLFGVNENLDDAKSKVMKLRFERLVWRNKCDTHGGNTRLRSLNRKMKANAFIEALSVHFVVRRELLNRLKLLQ